jgi:hypothetical protein
MAREVEATPYTNRHYPDKPTYTFTIEKLERFAHLVRQELLAEQQEPVFTDDEYETFLRTIHNITGETK